MNDQSGMDSEIPTEGDEERFVTLGRISGAQGLQGWVRVHSDTSPRENIVNYSPWYLETNGKYEPRKVSNGRRQGKAVVAKLIGCDDRDAAEALIGAMICIKRTQLPETTAPGEFYWADLKGLHVQTVDGVDLGHVEQLFETGSNDVMVVQGERERLVPYIWKQVVREVDLDAGEMLVDWDPDF